MLVEVDLREPIACLQTHLVGKGYAQTYGVDSLELYLLFLRYILSGYLSLCLLARIGCTLVGCQEWFFASCSSRIGVYGPTSWTCFLVAEWESCHFARPCI